MNESDLLPGDVIFFENNYKNEDMSPSYDYIDHVAIYAGLNESGDPLLVHSITSEQGYYEPTKPSGLCKTSLRALRNQLQQEPGYPDLYYDVTYKVFRFKNEAIRNKALAIMQTQAQYRIPYDEKKLNEKLVREETLEANDFRDLGVSLYRTEGIYRSIKYAARFPAMLTRTRINGAGRGLTCSMAVILAYQIAELLIDETIRPNVDNSWASDKHARLTPGVTYSRDYLNYLQTLHASEKFLRAPEPGLRLSYDFWLDQDNPPEHYTHTSFAVDSKSIGATGLFVYLAENEELWENHGVLLAQERTFSTTARQQNRAQNRYAYFEAITNVRDSCTQQGVRVSPAAAQLNMQDELGEHGEMDDLSGNWYDYCT